jgi:hypothetical protein
VVQTTLERRVIEDECNEDEEEDEGEWVHQFLWADHIEFCGWDTCEFLMFIKSWYTCIWLLNII